MNDYEDNDDSEKDLATSEFEEGCLINANTPKENYFNENPFNDLALTDDQDEVTIESSHKVADEVFRHKEVKEIKTRIPMLNGWTKQTKKISKEARDKSLNSSLKFIRLKSNTSNGYEKPSGNGLIAHFKNTAKIIKRGHIASKSAYDGNKLPESIIDFNKTKKFEEDFSVGKIETLTK